ncbi:MAG TPA: ferritin-like domain-containing protein [Streptosporangiaceae bacterium]|nr:ferritin-like domain-containing protein [Streptosporangiaceae bacterium]
MEYDYDATLKVLNEIVELELAGVVRYTQFSLMIFGHARIPIMTWMREQALESLAHATQAGEEVTTLGGNVSLGIGELVGTHPSSIDGMLLEMLAQERRAVDLYRKLLALTEGHNVSLEELARQMIRTEELDVAEIEKMLRKPGDA